MEEEILNDSLPDLKELENKVGRKTPESLLVWMRDAADCEDGWRADVVDRADRSSALSDSFSDKISNLKQEMRWLRSADVRILRQLVAVHEGIEAMRWLMEEREASASHGSSLTDSLSSLVMVDEHGPSMSPYRESLSPTQDLTEATGEESEDHPHTDHSDSNHKSFDMLRPESTKARTQSPSTSNFEATPSTQTSSNPLDGLVNLPMSQPQNSAVAPLGNTKADIIRSALLRSSRARKDVKVNRDSFGQPKQSEETQTDRQTQESLRTSQNKMMEKEESNREEILLGYDAQWCWVESQDDVTFL